MNTFYKESGVNVSLGDHFSRRARDISKSTWDNSPYVLVHDYAEHNFRGPRAFSFQHVPDGVRMDLGSDGVGTKVGVITAARTHYNAGRDLLAMKCMDRTRWGGLPLLCVNVLDVATLGKDENDPAFQRFVQLIEGMRDAANEIGVVLYGGETAELGVFVGAEDPNALTKFNWSGSAFGLVDEKRIITGARMQVGDVIIALKENGPRSNGLSAIRKALAMRFGKEWWNNPEAKDAVAQAAEPSVLYDKYLATMNGWFNEDFEPLIDMKCIVHITGGGIPSKFAEDILFPLGFSADLEDLYEPPQIMRNCAEWRGLEGLPVLDHECYETWNGGQGALVVVRASDESEFIRVAKPFGIEARACGRIQERDEPRLTIVSKFSDARLTYKPR